MPQNFGIVCSFIITSEVFNGKVKRPGGVDLGFI